MQVIGYARTSTEEQSNGIEAQRAQLQAEAERRGWTPDIRHEHASGKTLARRKALRDVLDDLDRAGSDGVLMVTKLDRLARSTIDCLNVLERASRKGWAVIVLNLGGEKLDTTTAAGKLQATMLAAFAEFEREMISDRTREGLAIVKARGVKLGHPSPVPEGTRRRIVRLRARRLSWRALADRLNADDVPGPAGGLWHPTSVHRVHAYAMRGNVLNNSTIFVPSGGPDGIEAGYERPSSGSRSRTSCRSKPVPLSAPSYRSTTR